MDADADNLKGNRKVANLRREMALSQRLKTHSLISNALYTFWNQLRLWQKLSNTTIH